MRSDGCAGEKKGSDEKLSKDFCFVHFRRGACGGQATAQIHGVVQDMSRSGFAWRRRKGERKLRPAFLELLPLNRTAITSSLTCPWGRTKSEVSKEGFSSVVQMGVVLQVGSDLPPFLSP